MSQDAIEATPRVGVRAAIRRLLGLHAHVFTPWTDCWAAPLDGGKMTLLQTRRCGHCGRIEHRQDVVDVPAAGFPYELHMDPAARPRG